MTHACEPIQDDLQLAAEQKTEQDETPHVAERPKSVEQQEPPDVHSKYPRKRWHDGAQAGQEFAGDDCAHSVLRQYVFGRSNTGMGPQRVSWVRRTENIFSQYGM